MTESNIPAVGVSLKTIAGSGKDTTEIVIQTHFPSDMSQEEMDILMDKYSSVLSRQRTVGEIPAIIENIEKSKKAIANVENEVEKLSANQQKDWEESGRTGPAQLSPANKQTREHFSVELKAHKERLANAEELLKAAYASYDEPYTEKRAVKTA